MNNSPKRFGILSGVIHRLLVLFGGVGLTFVFFMVLPLIQTITQPRNHDMVIQTLDTTVLPPPPPAPEEEEEEEEDEEEEEEPPELEEQAQPLDLSQLELALNPGFSDGLLRGDFGVSLNTVTSTENEVDALFSMSDLDQKPRVVYQPGPQMNSRMRKEAPGTVHIIFVVSKNGRVENPKIQKSTHPVFEKPALDAVKQWKFEPGSRQGAPVRFTMRVPISFPKD